MLLVLLADILLAIQFSLDKLYQKSLGSSYIAGLAFTAVSGLFSACVFFCVGGFKVEFSIFSLIMVTLFRVLCIVYGLIGFKLLQKGSISLYTLCLMSGGMCVPYIWGLLFLNEEFSVLRLIGLLVIIASMMFSLTDLKAVNKKTIPMYLAVFILNGFVSVTSKMHQISLQFNPVSSNGFVVMGGLVAFVISGTLFLFFKKTKGNDPQYISPEFKADKFLKFMPMLLVICIVGGVSSFCQLTGAKTLPASVLYPLITGGTIIFSSLAGMIFFKDKITKKNVISILVCFAGTCMFI